MDVFIARQPIFDRQKQVFAYQLHYRSEDCQAASGENERIAGTEAIGNALLTIGIDNLLCGKKAFISFDRSLLLGELPSILPPEVLVIELPPSVEPDQEVLDAGGRLHEQGYDLALDDFVPQARREPLARLARFLKVDVDAVSRSDQQQLLRTYRPRGIGVLADKVETQEDFEWAREAGYDYFQGYFFARPLSVRGRRIPASKFTCLLLLAEAQQPELDFKRLEALISRDVWLSYSLLLYVNSALFARTAEVHSINHAMAVLGEEGIRHWAVLAALPQLAKNKPGELVTVSLVRARLCERLASLAKVPPNQALLMGLFSLLDALTDLPLDEALDRVHAAPGIKAALIDCAPRGDPFWSIIQIVRRYERGEWKTVKELAATLGIAVSSISAAYAESTLWAQQTLHATFRKFNTRRHVRYAVTGPLHVLWEDREGKEAVIQATLMNVSVEGFQLLVSEKIPLLSYLRCNEPKFGLCARGRVRYCNYVKGKYLIGVECRSGTGWHPPADLA
ncbi:MAG TPA: HDOD domain-containing protein [Bryobacteraceae bacterium]|nr:HDOD domain-containing protein [Bryobacteraceae bacterium]